MKLIKQEYIFSDAFSAGILTVNVATLEAFKLRLQQSRHNAASNVRSVELLIEENGYDLGKPLVFNQQGKTIDGYTRGVAICNLIENNRLSTIYVSFIRTHSDAQAFNDTRGLSLNDIKQLFSRSKAKGVQAGGCERAAEQAVEASKMLDVDTMAFKLAFSPSRDQEHYVKIDQHWPEFSAAFDGVLDVLAGSPPSQYKFSHWLALFARHGVSATAVNLCRNYYISTQGTEQKDRYEAFKQLESTLLSTRAL